MPEPETTLTLSPELTVLEVIYRWRRTEEVFARYETVTGVCLRCRALFQTLTEVADQFHLDLEQLLAELQEAIGQPPPEED